GATLDLTRLVHHMPPLGERGGDHIVGRAHLVQADDVGRRLAQPGLEALGERGAHAVDVDGDDAHGFLSSDLARDRGDDAGEDADEHRVRAQRVPLVDGEERVPQVVEARARERGDRVRSQAAAHEGRQERVAAGARETHHEADDAGEDEAGEAQGDPQQPLVRDDHGDEAQDVAQHDGGDESRRPVDARGGLQPVRGRRGWCFRHDFSFEVVRPCGRPSCLHSALTRSTACYRPPRPAWRSADSTTLDRSIARVMGPTPPGLGECQEDLAMASAAMSPATLDLPVSGSVTRLTPTSTSATPSLTRSPVTMPGTPAAATMTSAVRVCAARSRVPVWHRVTVALPALRVSRRPMLRPTVVPRPMTTTSAPLRLTP